ncbi:hypothetical protein, partial [Nitrospirillum amazonense]|uniref:hypothetical protein n=1 Tax=Nitrospirillum amazonense TaxID=28077 RepID=UPI001B3B8D08
FVDTSHPHKPDLLPDSANNITNGRRPSAEGYVGNTCYKIPETMRVTFDHETRVGAYNLSLIKAQNGIYAWVSSTSLAE